MNPDSKLAFNRIYSAQYPKAIVTLRCPKWQAEYGSKCLGIS